MDKPEQVVLGDGDGDARPSIPAVLYAAKSTEDKHGSIPTQLADGRAMAERNGWVVAGEYQDEGISGYKQNRGPGLEAALAHVEALAAEHGVAMLVAQHSDRFARGGGDAPGAARHLGELMFQTRRMNVQLRSAQDDASLTNPLLAFVMGERNFEDSRRKSQATKDGKRRAAQRGQRNGGIRPYGYSRKNKELHIIPFEESVLHRMRTSVVAGDPLSHIARSLNLDGVRTVRGVDWTQTRISQILRGRVYIGKVKHRGEEFDGNHTPIFTLDQWDELQTALDARRRNTIGGRGRPTKGSHLFVGRMLRCGCCGSSVVPRTTENQGRVYELYRCIGQLSGAKPGCTLPGRLRRERIDGPVMEYFQAVGLDVDQTRRHFAELAEREVWQTRAALEEAERQVSSADASLARIRADYRAGKIDADDWREHRDDLTTEREAAAAEVVRLHSRVEEVLADAACIDAEEETLRFLAELRAAIAGEISNADGLGAVRFALLKLFDGFTLHSTHAMEAEPTYWQPELLLPGGLYIEPHPRADVIVTVGQGGSFPELRKVPVLAGETSIAWRR